MMTSEFFSGEILSKELMENVGTIFNIVLSSANKGEKYEKKVPVPGKKCYTLAKQRSDKSEFMEETMMDKKTQKIGVICSIVQIILSIICLIYSAINQENIIMWVLFLCSGILSLSSNISRNNKKEDE